MSRQTLSAFIWAVAGLLRGDYKLADYGKVILPFTVLHHLDCVPAPAKPAVLAGFPKSRDSVARSPCRAGRNRPWP
ncbi:type I restriction-modification system subunit M N-terminal domain-containing protein [Zavarzinia sp.]|uniref:type I restriction-modification system subunit M N-terminal domain-containing protein n=1 Tax=Zavarzinia sp. TaxID=2027920 RepID=UPI003BB63A3C|nr:type I restriction-modification system subunit M N-terminal domain-containing protein [Zavarzinia sp.]